MAPWQKAKAGSSRLWGLLPPARAGKNCARSRSPAPASQAFLQHWQSSYTLLLSAFWVLLCAQLSFLLSLGAHQLVQCRPCAKPLPLLESLLLGRTKPNAPENAVRGEATSTASGGKLRAERRRQQLCIRPRCETCMLEHMSTNNVLK